MSDLIWIKKAVITAVTTLECLNTLYGQLMGNTWPNALLRTLLRVSSVH